MGLVADIGCSLWLLLVEKWFYNESRQGRDGKFNVLAVVPKRLVLTGVGRFLTGTAAAELFIIGTEYLLVITVIGNTGFVVIEGLRRKVEKTDHVILWITAEANEGENRIHSVLEIEPAKTFVMEIALPEGAAARIYLIEFGDTVLELAMEGVFLEKVPVKAPFTVPLGVLAEFAAHKKQILSGMTPEQGI